MPGSIDGESFKGGTEMYGAGGEEGGCAGVDAPRGGVSGTASLDEKGIADGGNDEELRRTVIGLHALMETVRYDHDYSVRLPNRSVPNCWEVKKCGRAGCPCYGKPGARCWQVVGTHCRGEIQGAFAQKIGKCETCEVYSLSTGTFAFRLAETFHNMLAMISQKQTDLEEAKTAAESSESAKSQFLANMSHEIRTPMNGVIGMADVLAQTCLTDQQREYLDVIRVSGETLLTLLDDILDVSKIDSGRLELESVDFNLTDLVESLTCLISPKAVNKNVELVSRIDPNVPARLRGDPTRLRQILTNLIGNAIKFTERGDVLLDISLLEHLEDAVSIRFAVKDSGIGIAADQVAKIFDPFTQAESSTSRRFGGTGLGLTISRHLVGLMGGELTVASRPGEGSTFEFTVLLNRGAEGHDLSQAAGARTFKGCRALLIDDNQTNLWILSEMMTTWGFDIVDAESGPEGLVAFKQAADRGTPFGLVIVDKQMPAMDGDETVRGIRSAPGGGEPRIIQLSSCAGDDSRKLAEEAGCDAFMTKPVRRLRLLDSLLGLLDRRKVAEIRPAPPVAGPAEGDAAVSPARVLLVEDNAVNQMVVVKILEQAGHLVECACEGGEALDLLEQDRAFDLVLMDVQMPGMDGYQATREIRSRPQVRSLPVVAMTAHALTGDREKCLKAGMDDYLSKPVQRKVLLEKIGMWRGATSEATAEASPVAGEALSS
ncbi:MAG: response regulator [Candidatus Eisenbacteria bacterium]